ncbi:DUF3667 domain-containing protein [Candidatus Phycosocius spiralis]|uniref:Uncharacterized protein n=1 Tax=Candidatus Phycosocius spiralis TaxID=2815099 RepID=A0ABQ4PSD5_9PROT|nr:DUF3667 domain-containing protein [Candidatus Phycosocius spiralis]GIU65917.1 hypothetical protein PsB1_0071 [Candidatus Phycosocius spiralis]
MLVFRLGTLTRRYVMGLSSHYVPPFSMFLASNFAMFLVFAITGTNSLVHQTSHNQTPHNQSARTNSDFATKPKKLEAARKSFQLALKIEYQALKQVEFAKKTLTASLSGGPTSATNRQNEQTIEVLTEEDWKGLLLNALSKKIKINTQ